MTCLPGTRHCGQTVHFHTESGSAINTYIVVPIRVPVHRKKSLPLKTHTFFSVPNLWHFDSDPDPHLWLTDPDHALFVSFYSLFANNFSKTHLHHSSKIKGQTDVTKQYKWRFFLVFCLMMEGSESVPLTNGSGFGRPKSGTQFFVEQVIKINAFLTRLHCGASALRRSRFFKYLF